MLESDTKAQKLFSHGVWARMNCPRVARFQDFVELVQSEVALARFDDSAHFNRWKLHDFAVNPPTLVFHNTRVLKFFRVLGRIYVIDKLPTLNSYNGSFISMYTLRSAEFLLERLK